LIECNEKKKQALDIKLTSNSPCMIAATIVEQKFYPDKMSSKRDYNYEVPYKNIMSEDILK